MSRRFERHLDVDLIERMANGWRPHAEPQPLKKQKPSRLARTYRAARRNQQLKVDRGVWYPPKTRYVPTVPRGTAAYRAGGKAHPEFRVPPLRYPTNGPREVTRRLRRMAG